MKFPISDALDSLIRIAALLAGKQSRFLSLKQKGSIPGNSIKLRLSYIHQKEEQLATPEQLKLRHRILTQLLEERESSNENL